MKKTKIMALVLCLAMLVGSMSVFASAVTPANLDGVYTIDGTTLTLKINLKNNPGINTLVFGLAYDAEAVALDTITNGDVFCEANNGSMFEVNTENNPLIFYFDENSYGNIKANGTVVTVVFNVLKESEDYGLALTVDNDSTYGVSEDAILPVDILFAEPTVKEQNFIPGDLDGDGKINANDANIMKRCILGITDFIPAGDVDGDGKINATDYNILKKMILGVI